MLEEKYLDQAIAQNLGADDPDAWTCMRLAAQLYLKDRLYGQPVEPAPPEPSSQDFALADAPQTPADEIVYYSGKSEFAREIDGKRAAEIWPIMDEMMSLFAALHPDMYKRAIEVIKAK